MPFVWGTVTYISLYPVRVLSCTFMKREENVAIVMSTFCVIMYNNNNVKMKAAIIKIM
jgi:hypothetical protein